MNGRSTWTTYAARAKQWVIRARWGRQAQDIATKILDHHAERLRNSIAAAIAASKEGK